MAKPMTKAKLVTALAEATDIPKKTSAAYLEALARLAAFVATLPLGEP